MPPLATSIKLDSRPARFPGDDDPLDQSAKLPGPPHTRSF